MKEIKVRGLDIKVPNGSPFAYDTPEALPKAHQNCLIVAPRGQGKTTFAVNLIEQMPYDRIICVSPSIKSNAGLLSRLKINPDDVYEDPDDIEVVDKIKASIEKERDDLEEYLEKKKKYKELMKYLNKDDGVAGGFRISDDLLMAFYQNGSFEPPVHKWGLDASGNPKKPCIAVLFDDCLGSQLFTKGIRKLNALTIYHRHTAQLKGGGAIGCSLYFLLQSFKCSSGGLSKCIRGNTTSLAVGRTKSDKELDEIAEECGGEIKKTDFLKIHNQATKDSKFDFLFCDFNKKKEHPSMFRRNLDTFLVL